MSDLYLGRGEQDVFLRGKYANRHGLIAGATGTGKSVSLTVMAEGFSRLGVPVFLADVKGDLAGIGFPGVMNERVQKRLDTLGKTDWKPESNPSIFWDIFGLKGHPIRATVSEMGPSLISRLFELNDTQEGVLQVVFKVADESGMLLLDLDDLRAMLAFVSEHAKEISAQYGLVSPQSIAAIQRKVLQIEQEGGNKFFGEPALDLKDFMRQDMSGRGIINILAADQLILKPRLYSTFLLWMLSELFENLPEVGDLPIPKLVFFFDEAHLLFDDAPPALQQRVEQVVRLIRSKGVGVYFCSQLPDDVPDVILGQLGNRVQHALRAFTPRDQKAVRIAAETFAQNPKFKVVDVITQLGVGEALVSTLQEGGIPLPVEKTLVAPPQCRLGAITDDERNTIKLRSPLGAKYDTEIDRESAFELLQKRAQEQNENKSVETRSIKQGVATPTEDAGFGGKLKEWMFGTSRRQGAVEAMTKSAMRTVGNKVGQQILRGILGGIFKGR